MIFWKIDLTRENVTGRLDATLNTRSAHCYLVRPEYFTFITLKLFLSDWFYFQIFHLRRFSSRDQFHCTAKYSETQRFSNRWVFSCLETKSQFNKGKGQNTVDTRFLIYRNIFKLLSGPVGIPILRITLPVPDEMLFRLASNKRRVIESIDRSSHRRDNF